MNTIKQLLDQYNVSFAEPTLYFCGINLKFSGKAAANAFSSP
jgi:hypothetical protein